MAVVKEVEPTAFGISAKMARALADTWRVRILAELSVRPLSPSRFVEEVGGELTHISRCFRQLAECGYIEVIEERPGRRQGAAIEHVYRGIQRAHFDTSTWEGFAHSERDTVSRSAINSYFERIVEAVKGGTFDQETDRHFSWDRIAVDHYAWTQLGGRLDAILAWLPELEVEASIRLRGTHGESIPAITGLSAFRSPQSPLVMLQASHRHGPRVEVSNAEPLAIGSKMVKALSNKWRCRILMELVNRPLSASQFVEEVGGSMTHISRCFRELAEWGYVEVIEERKGGRRGGGVERVYRNVQQPYFDTPTWRRLPRIVREEMSHSFLHSYVERVNEALVAGTFDADTDRHFSWKPLVLDRLAWAELAEALDETLNCLPTLEAESLKRIESDNELIPTIIGLASFRSPSPAGISAS